MEDEKAVILLIENELYRYIKLIRENYTRKEAEDSIKHFTDEFKQTVLKKYSVKDIDGLIEKTLKEIDNKEKEIAD